MTRLSTQEEKVTRGSISQEKSRTVCMHGTVAPQQTAPFKETTHF